MTNKHAKSKTRKIFKHSIKRYISQVITPKFIGFKFKPNSYQFEIDMDLLLLRVDEIKSNPKFFINPELKVILYSKKKRSKNKITPFIDTIGGVPKIPVYRKYNKTFKSKKGKIIRAAKAGEVAFYIKVPIKRIEH